MKLRYSNGLQTKRPRIESDNEEDDDGVSIPIRPILRKDTVKSKGKGKAKATTDDEQEEGNTPVGWVDYPVETEEELSDSFLSEQVSLSSWLLMLLTCPPT